MPVYAHVGEGGKRESGKWWLVLGEEQFTGSAFKLRHSIRRGESVSNKRISFYIW